MITVVWYGMLFHFGWNDDNDSHHDGNKEGCFVLYCSPFSLEGVDDGCFCHKSWREHCPSDIGPLFKVMREPSVRGQVKCFCNLLLLLYLFCRVNLYF